MFFGLRGLFLVVISKIALFNSYHIAEIVVQTLKEIPITHLKEISCSVYHSHGKMQPYFVHAFSY